MMLGMEDRLDLTVFLRQTRCRLLTLVAEKRFPRSELLKINPVKRSV